MWHYGPDVIKSAACALRLGIVFLSKIEKN
jgi:hypothetical protein